MQSSRRGTDRACTKMFSRSSRPTPRTKHSRFLRVEPLEQRVVLSTYWVSPSGNDSNSGSASSPFATPQHAMMSLQPGDTLDIKSGSYTGFIVGWDSTPANSGDPYGTINGTACNPITIQADPNAAPGSVVINSRDNKTPCGIDIEPGCSYVTLKGLTVANGDGSISQYGIKFSTGSNFIVENCTVHSCGKTGIFSSFVTNSLVQNNVSYSNGEHGYYMSNSPQNVTVINNIGYDNATAGMEVNADASQGGPGTAQNITIANNIFYNNNTTHTSGALNLDGVQNSHIYNNILYNNNATGLVLYDGDASAGCINNVVADNTIVMPTDTADNKYALDNNTNSYGNLFYNNIILGSFFVDSGSIPGAWSNNILAVGYYTDLGDGTNWTPPTGLESTTSALFINPSGNNYQLSSTSPAIGAGTATDAPSTDLLGNPRPSGNGYDIGAYEYQAGPVTPTVTSETPASGATNVAVSTAPTATFNEALQAGTISFTLKSSSGTVAGSASYNSTTNVTTFTPTSALAYNTTYTATISGAQSASSVPMTAPFSWSFTTDAAPPAVTSETPASGATGVAVSTTATATFNEALQAGTISFTLKNSSGSSVAGSVSYNSTTYVTTFTPTPTSALASNTTYTATISGAQSMSGVSMTAPFSWSFTTTAASSTTSIWSSTAKPANPSDPDSSAVELGVKFYSDVSGSITGLRFYKGSTNTGTHVADLWTSSGKLLATATFTSETGSGWQQVNFATPVAITAGTTYVASYHTNVGHYADDQNYFASQYNSGSLHVPANGGVYAYGAAGSFPTQVWNASNYWVDVMLSPSGSPSIATTATAKQSVSVPTVVAPSSGSSSQLVNGAGAIQPGGLAIPGQSSASATAKLQGKSLSAQWAPAVVGRLNPAAQSALVKPINRRFMTNGGSGMS